MSATDSSNIILSNIGFRGNEVAYSGWARGLLMFGVNNLLIEKCSFQGIGDTCLTTSKEGTTGGDGVPWGAAKSSSVRINDNDFVNNFGSHAIGTKKGGAKEVFITNNKIINTGATGISIENEGSTGPTDLVEKIHIIQLV